ncbi:MAG TPA: nuclear transport factor 2 family protein [Trebonia sp.]|jgi:ketosteroid isomerase-like protein
MTEDQLPATIARFIQATNQADSDAFAAAFTDDAYLNDRGREFHGRDGVRSWDKTDNIGVRAHFEFVSAEAGDAPDRYVVTLKVTGDGFNGNGPMSFELRDGHIAALRIS